MWQTPLMVLVGTDAEVQGIVGEREREAEIHTKIVKNKSSI